MADHQAPPSLGFSRQEYWSGVPLPFLHVWSDDFQRMLREFIDRQTVSQQTVRMQLGCCCCYVASVVSDSVRPIDGSPPGFPSLGFSRQEHWSGLPFPSPMHESESEIAQSCPIRATPWTAAYQAPPSMGFSRQEYWSGVPLPSPSALLGIPM